MKRRVASHRRSGCPIGIALDLFGDAWSLLIVRDLMFKGATTFNEFKDAGEGIATNVLTDRLAKLEAAGIIAKSPDPADARRYRYGLTPKGADLAPVLIEIVLWSAKYEQTEAPAATVRQMKTQREKIVAEIRRRAR